jgi:hypothetical protein
MPRRPTCRILAVLCLILGGSRKFLSVIGVVAVPCFVDPDPVDPLLILAFWIQPVITNCADFGQVRN